MRWVARRKRLQLSLTAEARPLCAEVAESRFQSLANALGADTKVIDT